MDHMHAQGEDGRDPAAAPPGQDTTAGAGDLGGMARMAAEFVAAEFEERQYYDEDDNLVIEHGPIVDGELVVRARRVIRRTHVPASLDPRATISRPLPPRPGAAPTIPLGRAYHEADSGFLVDRAAVPTGQRPFRPLTGPAPSSRPLPSPAVAPSPAAGAAPTTPTAPTDHGAGGASVGTSRRRPRRALAPSAGADTGQIMALAARQRRLAAPRRRGRRPASTAFVPLLETGGEEEARWAGVARAAAHNARAAGKRGWRRGRALYVEHAGTPSRRVRTRERLHGLLFGGVWRAPLTILACLVLVAIGVSCAVAGPLAGHLAYAPAALPLHAGDDPTGAAADPPAGCDPARWAGCGARATPTPAPGGGVPTPAPSQPLGTAPAATPAPVGPTATPDPHAASATVTFAQASRAWAGPSGFQACDSGCYLNNKQPTYRAYGTGTSAASGGLWGVSVHFHVVNMDCSAGCAILLYSHDGGYCTNWGYNAAERLLGVTVTGSPDTWQYIWCTASRQLQGDDFWGGDPAAPATDCYGWLNGTCQAGIWITNDVAAWLTVVQQGDCNTAIARAQAAAQADAGNHPASGQEDHDVYRWEGGFGGGPCGPGVGAQAPATSETSFHDVWWRGYNDADAQAVAHNLLANNTPPPAGWAIKPNSEQGCPNPGSVGAPQNDGNHTYTVNCQHTETLVYDWTAPGVVAALQQALAGKGAADATAACNAYAGVSPGSCKIALSGGSLLPATAAGIAVNVVAA